MNAVYARFLARFKAFLFDYIIIFLYLVSIVVMSMFIEPKIQELFLHSVLRSQLTAFCLVTLPVALYFSFFDSGLSHGTFGKRKMELKVINSKGKRPSFFHSFGRNLVKFIPWGFGHYTAFRMANVDDNNVAPEDWIIGILTYMLILAYILTAIFTKKKQSVYDIAVNTYVLKDK